MNMRVQYFLDHNNSVELLPGNISRTGISFQTDHALAVKSYLMIQLVFENNETMRVLGRVVWSAPEDHYFTIGVDFAYISERDYERIGEMIEEHPDGAFEDPDLLD